MKPMRLLVAAACAVAATASSAQTGVQDGRWNCQVGGQDIQLGIAGDTATLAFANGERFTLKHDATRSRPLFTDGKVGLRMGGGGPASTRGPELLRHGEASSITRCIPAP